MRPNYYRRRIILNWGLSARWIFRILCLVGIWFLAEEGFEKFKEIKARSYAVDLVEVAKKQLVNDRRDLAVISLRSAVDLSPECLPALRLLGQVLDENNDRRAMDCYRFVVFNKSILPGELANLGSGTSASAFFSDGENTELTGANFDFKSSANFAKGVSKDDVNRLIWAAVKYGESRIAIQVANMAARVWKQPALPDLIRAAIHQMEGNLVEQERDLRNAVARQENQETLSALSTFLMQQKDADTIHAAELGGIFQKMAALGEEIGRDALRTGIEMGIVPLSQREAWLRQYRNHPAADHASRLVADDLEMRLNPSLRQNIIQRVLDQSRSLTARSRLDSIKWLLAQNEPSAALTLMPLIEAIRDEEFFLLWLKVAGVAGNWKDVESALQLPENPLRPYQKLPLLAVAIGKRGDTSGMHEIFRKALQLTSKNPEELSSVLQGLLRMGEWNLFKSHAGVLFENPEFARKSLAQFESILAADRDASRFLALYEQAFESSFFSKDPLLIYKLDRLKILLGVPPSLEDQLARLLNDPNNQAFRMNCVLTLLKSGKKARAVYEFSNRQNKIRPESLDPEQKVVFVGVLMAESRVKEAREFASGIPRKKLTREDEALLDGFLGN